MKTVYLYKYDADTSIESRYEPSPLPEYVEKCVIKTDGDDDKALKITKKLYSPKKVEVELVRTSDIPF